MDVNAVINLIFTCLIFAIAAYAGFWVCDRAKMPVPVFWVFGCFLLIIILLFLSGQLSMPQVFHFRR